MTSGCRCDRVAAIGGFCPSVRPGGARRAIALTIQLVVLEHLSEAGSQPVKRYTSKGELGTLQRLIGKYGEDVEAMARDRKLNADQRTAGELRRAIRKAGGFAAVGRGG